MKKLNNKGMSLIELIISFSLVSVAVIYFFQTLFITNKIFKRTREDTNRYVDVAYAFNIIDYYVHEGDFKKKFNEGNLTGAKEILDSAITSKLTGAADVDFVATVYKETPTSVDTMLKKATISGESSDYIYYYKFFIDGKEYYYFFAIATK